MGTVAGTREHGDISRFELLASAIVGRSVTIERTEEKCGAWTDGKSIFLGPDASETAVLQCVLVQAALLGAGSFDGEIVDRLVRSTKLCRRYLFVEGHRALEALEAMLPPSARRLSNPGIAALSKSPSDSLAIASGRQVFADPPEAFGVIRPRRIRRQIVASGIGFSAAAVPAEIAGSGAPSRSRRRSRGSLLKARTSCRARSEGAVQSAECSSDCSEAGHRQRPVHRGPTLQPTEVVAAHGSPETSGWRRPLCRSRHPATRLHRVDSPIPNGMYIEVVTGRTGALSPRSILLLRPLLRSLCRT